MALPKKFPDLSPSHVCLALGLMAAVLASHIWAPGAISTVASLAGTLVGVVFVDLRKRGDNDDK